jgi:hypothetical protein
VNDDTAAEKAERLGIESEIFVIVAERRDLSVWCTVENSMLSG